MVFSHQQPTCDSIDPTKLPPPPLPSSTRIISRFIDISPWSLVFHILGCVPAIPVQAKTELILLVHGFPEVAYSWRKVLPQLAAHGYHAVAYDTRGSGRTFSRKPVTRQSFRPINFVRDALALINALGYKAVSCIAGHDFGAVTATVCGLARPDIFKSVVLMSHPVRGPLAIPLRTDPSYGSAESSSSSPTKPEDVRDALAHFEVPRKHYQRYYCESSANEEMTNSRGEPLHEFLRGYFHLKSGDWEDNRPHHLDFYNAKELATMPGYYIMPLHLNMRETVAREMRSENPTNVAQQSERWLNEEELSYYVQEWARTPFLGGLNRYRLTLGPDLVAVFCVWTHLRITVPTLFMSGSRDWGPFQDTGALEDLENKIFVEKGRYRATVLIDGAGHWINQERPTACTEEIMKLAREVDRMESIQ